MGWLGDGSHRGQVCQAWTAVGLTPRYPLPRRDRRLSWAGLNHSTAEPWLNKMTCESSTACYPAARSFICRSLHWRRIRLIHFTLGWRHHHIKLSDVIEKMITRQMAPTTSHESLGRLIASALFQCRPMFIFDHLRNDYIFEPQLLCNRFPPGLFANLPTLNSSKTEFLIIGLNRQLSKTDNSSPFILHATLVLFLMNILHVPSLIRFHHFL